jgi:hypothetical protein
VRNYSVKLHSYRQEFVDRTAKEHFARIHTLRGISFQSGFHTITLSLIVGHYAGGFSVEAPPSIAEVAKS